MSALAGLVDRGLVAPDWAEALAPVDDTIAAMGGFLREELAAGRTYLPAGDRILRAFERPLSDVRVLVVGQDPYPTPGHAVGLSFSVAPEVRPLPRSLVNIFRELYDDLGVGPPTNGDLTPWADAGVLLLNRVLTVAPGERDASVDVRVLVFAACAAIACSLLFGLLPALRFSRTDLRSSTTVATRGR